jgi:hypothetical protein
MGTSNTLGYSFAEGVLIAIITLIIGWQTVSYGANFTKFIWLILPILSYAISFGSLAIVNNFTCGSINYSLVATSSIFMFGSVVFFLGLSYFSFFQNFIVPVLPINLQYTYGPIVATAFFMFWAGMYGSAFGYGFAQSCPS